MEFIKSLIKNYKAKYLCKKEKHDWEDYIRGNAMVDNLNETWSMWSIGARSCKSCKLQQVNIKDGWQNDRELTVNDLI